MEDGIVDALIPVFRAVIKDFKLAVREQRLGEWYAIKGPTPSYISIKSENEASQGGSKGWKRELKTMWTIHVVLSHTASSANFYTRVIDHYPEEKDVYEAVMFFGSQGPWRAANSIYFQIKALFEVGVPHDAVRDFLDEETVQAVMHD